MIDHGDAGARNFEGCHAFAKAHALNRRAFGGGSRQQAVFHAADTRFNGTVCLLGMNDGDSGRKQRRKREQFFHGKEAGWIMPGVYR
ncbi:hypothetical protein [Massilia sp. YIM B04103]|uniref:hypothetical protein n=1 Tax=Massilia sp. YIM B04103 TaxID=2963106 RepID=UPI00210865CB|nr:hypothetical protein [Massilia sp. YIM B04103]